MQDTWADAEFTNALRTRGLHMWRCTEQAQVKMGRVAPTKVLSSWRWEAQITEVYCKSHKTTIIWKERTTVRRDNSGSSSSVVKEKKIKMHAAAKPNNHAAHFLCAEKSFCRTKVCSVSFCESDAGESRHNPRSMSHQHTPYSETLWCSSS